MDGRAKGKQCLTEFIVFNTRSNMFDAARDVWFPYLHRSLVAAADGCKECTDAGRSLKPLCAKGDIGKVYEPREPNECLQLDF